MSKKTLLFTPAKPVNLRLSLYGSIFHKKCFGDMNGEVKDIEADHREDNDLLIVEDVENAKKRVRFDLPPLEECDDKGNNNSNDHDAADDIVIDDFGEDNKLVGGIVSRPNDDSHEEAYAEQREKYKANDSTAISFRDVMEDENFKTRDHLEDVNKIIQLLIVNGMQIGFKGMNPPFMSVSQFVYMSAQMVVENLHYPLDEPRYVTINFDFGPDLIDADIIAYVTRLLNDNIKLLKRVFRVRDDPWIDGIIEISEGLKPHFYRRMYYLTNKKRHSTPYGKRQFHTLYVYKFDNEAEVLVTALEFIGEARREEYSEQIFARNLAHTEKIIGAENMRGWTGPTMKMNIRMVEDPDLFCGVDQTYKIANTTFKPIGFDSPHMRKVTKLTVAEQYAIKFFPRPVDNILATTFDIFEKTLTRLEFIRGKTYLKKDIDAVTKNDNPFTNNGYLKKSKFTTSAHRHPRQKQRDAETVEEQVRDYSILAKNFGDLYYFCSKYMHDLHVPNAHRIDAQPPEPMTPKDHSRLMALRKLQFVRMFCAYYTAASLAIIGDFEGSVRYYQNARPFIVKYMSDYPKVIMLFFLEMMSMAIAYVPTYPEAVEAFDMLQSIARRDTDRRRREAFERFSDRVGQRLEENKKLYRNMEKYESGFYANLIKDNVLFGNNPAPPRRKKKDNKSGSSSNDNNNNNNNNGNSNNGNSNNGNKD